MATRKAKSPLVKGFAKRLRSLREKSGLSQEELAAKAGLHRTYISLIERAKQSVTLDTMEKLASALGVPVKKLMP